MHFLLLYFLLVFSTLSSGEHFQPEDHGTDLFSQLLHTIKTRNTTIDLGARLRLGATRKKIPKQDYIVNFTSYLSDRGAYRLRRLGFILKRHVDIHANVIKLILNATQNYFTKLYKYYTIIDSFKLKNDYIDTEYLYLDMIETSNKILFDSALFLLGNIVAISNVNKSALDAEMLTEKIKSATLDEKKEQIKFICKKVHICRHYPAYSDHFAKLLEALFNLPDEKFTIIAKFMEKLIRKESEAFTKIMKPSVANAIGLKLELLSENIYELRGVLNFVRRLINNSYNVFRGLNEKMLMKSKALRLLLDIIDKAFNQNGADVIQIEYDTLISLLRQWGGGYKYDIKLLLTDFFDGILHVINHVLSPRATEEIQVLMDILYNGEVLYSDVFNELFLHGSRFVKGEDTQNEFIDFTNFIAEIE